MAYKIYAGSSYQNGKISGGNVIHDAFRSEEFRIADSAKLVLHAGWTPDTLTFTLSPKHPHQELRKLIPVIRVFEDDEQIFRGRIVDIKKDFYNRITYTCESDKAYFCDTLVRPFTFNGTISDFLTFLINNHNEMIAGEAGRSFSIGSVTVTDPRGTIERSSEKPMTTFAALNDKLLKILGGYLRIRLEGNAYKIDYLSDFPTNAGQIIEFGKNLLDLSEVTNATTFANCILPYGEKLDSSSSSFVHVDTSADGGHTYHGNKTNIIPASSSGGVDCILNASSISEYGRYWTTKTWDDLSDPNHLYNKANAFINGNVVNTTITATAADLHAINVDISKIRVGQYVRCKSGPHDIDMNLLCTDCTIDMLKPDNNKVTLGTTVKSLTGSVSRAGAAASATMESDDSVHKCDKCIVLSPTNSVFEYDDRHKLTTSNSGVSAISKSAETTGSTAYLTHSAFDAQVDISGTTKAQLYGNKYNAYLMCGTGEVKVGPSAASLKVTVPNGDSTSTNGVDVNASHAMLYKAGAGVTCENSAITAYSAQSAGHGELVMNSTGATLVAKDKNVGLGITSDYTYIYGGASGFKGSNSQGATMYSGNNKIAANGNQIKATVSNTSITLDGSNASMNAGGHELMVSAALGVLLDGKRIVTGTGNVKYGGTQTTKISFGVTFASKPIVITSQPFSGGNVIISDGTNTGSGAITTENFSVTTTGIGGSSYVGTREFFWIAIGSMN